ncbi:MAG: hypothetical protein OEM27_09055 [Nitrospinota bacterium]|nr:hypothetical protein [Nitrospinota bacterium]
MTYRNILIAGILLAGLLMGCGKSDSDPFVRFQVEGQSYEVKDPTFMVTRIKGKLHLMDLTHFPKSSMPGASIQWQMNLDSVENLAGKNLDLNTVTPPAMPPLVIFQLTKDLTAHGQEQSDMHFKIDRIEEGMIEGSFSGKDFMYVSMTKEVTHEVDVTARFRVQLDFK